MSKVTIDIPEHIRMNAEEFARRNDITLDQTVALALASHAAAWNMKGYLEERAKRGRFTEFRELMEQHVPDVEPEAHDRL